MGDRSVKVPHVLCFTNFCNAYIQIASMRRFVFNFLVDVSVFEMNNIRMRSI